MGGKDEGWGARAFVLYDYIPVSIICCLPLTITIYSVIRIDLSAKIDHSRQALTAGSAVC